MAANAGALRARQVARRIMDSSLSTFRPVSIDTLRELTDVQCRPCVSIYGRTSLIPSLLAEANFRLVHSVTPRPGASEKRTVRSAMPRRALRRKPVTSIQKDLARELLGPLRSAINQAPLDDYTSVALFASPDGTWAVEVPVTVRAGLSIGEAFALGPLLSLFGTDCVYAVRLTPAQPAIMRVTPDAVEPLDASALEEQLTQRRAVAVSRPAFAGATRGAFRGGEDAGSWPDPSDSASSLQVRRKDPFQERVRWMSRVDRLLGEVLPRPNHPVFLAGSDEACSLYQSLHPHRHVLPGRIDEIDDPAVLAHAARRSSRSAAMDRRRDAMIQFYELQAYDPSRTCTGASEIAAAARARRVETLFVDEALSEFKPPSYPCGDGAPRRVFGGEVPTTPSPVSSHAVEHTIAHTVIGGGTFYPVHGTVLPPGHRMAALLRY